MSRFWAGLGIKLLGKADYYREIPEIREKGRGVSKFYSPRGGGGLRVEVMDTLWANEELSSGLGTGVAQRSLCRSQPTWDRPQ